MTPTPVLFDESLSVRDRALVALAEAGISAEKIASLRRGDLVVWDASGTVLVRLRHRRGGNGNPAPKESSRSSYELLDGAAASAVARYLDELGAEAGDPLFRARAGRPISWRGIYYVVRRALGRLEAAA